jgi:hypothetical protein
MTFHDFDGLLDIFLKSFNRRSQVGLQISQGFLRILKVLRIICKTWQPHKARYSLTD